MNSTEDRVSDSLERQIRAQSPGFDRNARGRAVKFHVNGRLAIIFEASSTCRGSKLLTSESGT